jgi:hypothetical protein
VTASTANILKALGLVTLGIAIAVAGIMVGEYDDAPGASVGGILLMLGSMVLAVRIARRKAS